MPSNINFDEIKFKKKYYFWPTDPNFFQHVTVNTLIIFFWPYNKEQENPLICNLQQGLPYMVYVMSW